MRLGLGGDTMLGRGVAERLAVVPPAQLFDDDLVAVVHEADLVVVNLECAISDRGERWPDPRKPFFFRAPPAATQALAHLGVDCVTLANNHALDYGAPALLDTLHHLHAAGIAAVGAGPDLASARRPEVLIASDGTLVGVLGVTDHPAAFAAGEHPGVAYADLRHGVPPWLVDAVREVEADVVLVTPHWGPNMVTEPVPHVRTAAAVLRAAGADLVAGHSAHVPQGVGDRVLFDLGDLIDDYARHPGLRNELGLFFLVTVEDGQAVEVEAVPLALEHCRTRLATGDDAAWVARAFRRRCADLGTEVSERDGRLVVRWEPQPASAGR